MRPLVCLPFFPTAVDVVHTQIDLAFGVIGQIGVYDTPIQSELSSIAGDLEHLVNARLHNARMNLCLLYTSRCV